MYCFPPVSLPDSRMGFHNRTNNSERTFNASVCLNPFPNNQRSRFPKTHPIEGIYIGSKNR